MNRNITFARNEDNDRWLAGYEPDWNALVETPPIPNHGPKGASIPLNQGEQFHTTLPAPKQNRDAVMDFLRRVIPAGQVFEVRALSVEQKYGAACTLSGYFNIVDAAADAVSTITGAVRGIYFAPNPVDPALLSRCANRLKRCGRGDPTTGDHEIERRRWLLLDFDPERPAGICATEEERAAAHALADQVVATLSAEGWPDPVRCDSGNGAQLMYRVELPADDGGLCERITKALAARFNTDAVHIDECVHNAARIWRLPGTVNRKGDHTQDRPHRLARLVHVPEDLQPVARELLESVGKEADASDTGTKSGRRSKGKTGAKKRRCLSAWNPERIEELFDGPLRQCGPGNREEYRDGVKWKLKQCPFDSSHVDSAALFFGKGPGFTCLHNSCADRDFHALLDWIETNGGTVPDAAEGTARGGHVIDQRNYYGTAETFIADNYSAGDAAGLLHHQDSFRRYTGTHYADHDLAALRCTLWKWLVQADVDDKDGNAAPYKPNTNAINNTIDAIKAVANFPADYRPPCWLPGYDGPAAAELLPFNNTLLHLPAGKTYPHTPGLFITNALPFDYDPKAQSPEWLAFLQKLWPDDPEAIKTLQLIFGYLIGGGTYLQKIFLLVGPRRGGRGTIARILVALLGPDACCGPTLAGLPTQFGLQSLIGKRLAVISDARLSSRADQAAITERLLTISGEDTITIPRKYSTDWTGQLPTRFLLLTNELPRLADSSGAMASRFIVLTMQQSFLGREDHGLAARLLKDLPGIANWAIEGWRELQRLGRIESPGSAGESIEDLNDLGSPVGAFIRYCCCIGPEYKIERQALYRAWCEWCETHGRKHPGTEESFGRDLRAAFPALKSSQPRVGTGRMRFYEGITTVCPGSAYPEHGGTGSGTGSGTGKRLVDTSANKGQKELEQDGTCNFGSLENYRDHKEERTERSEDDNGPAHVPACSSADLVPPDIWKTTI